MKNTNYFYAVRISISLAILSEIFKLVTFSKSYMQKNKSGCFFLNTVYILVMMMMMIFCCCRCCWIYFVFYTLAANDLWNVFCCLGLLSYILTKRDIDVSSLTWLVMAGYSTLFESMLNWFYYYVICIFLFFFSLVKLLNLVICD